MFNIFVFTVDPVNCGHLPFVPFTRNTTTGTHYLDNITYTCSQGYIHINGTLSRQCKSDRVWDGIEPTCSKFLIHEFKFVILLRMN